MSKAFLREDDLNEEDLPPPPAVVLPPGIKNYLTAAGFERLKQESETLTLRRAGLLARGDDPDAKRRAKILEQRIRYLQQSLRTAEVVAPAAGPAKIARFGSNVTVRDSLGVETRYRIVGVDESDPARNEISWQSPLAQALLNARLDEVVRFQTPRGSVELKITRLD